MLRKYWSSQPKSKTIYNEIEGYSSWLEVDLDAITWNLNEIRRHTTAAIMPCIKNNAYGHGLIPIAAHLADQGIKHVLVAKLMEAELIKDKVGINVVNMDPLFTLDQHELAVKKGLTQVVYTIDTVKKLSRAATQLGKNAKIFVKIDTGLRRVGIWHSEASNTIEKMLGYKGIQLEGIMSTLMQNPEQDSLQIERLLRVDLELRKKGIDPGLRSIASTDAIINNPAAHLDLVRPGISIYGVFPEKKDQASCLNLKQALSFKTRLEYCKWIEKGDSVTYWGKFRAPEKMRIGTLHIGFYDGIPRELANKARIKIDSKYTTSIGSISLNHMLVDLTDTNVKDGDIVEVIGRKGENSLSAMSETAGWMVYSLLNHLNLCIPRVYYKNEKPVALLKNKLH